MIRYLLLLWLCLAPSVHANGLLDRIGLSSGQADFLQPDAAFGLSISAQNKNVLIASFKVTPDYYLYRNKISFAISGNPAKIAAIKLPPGEIKHDANFGTLEVYHQSFQAEIDIEGADASRPVVINASYQGCSEKGLCYPPIEKTLNVDLAQAVSNAPAPTAVSGAAAPETDSSRIANVFKQGSFWLVITFFFGAGLLLAFTPCVFPMIPILSGIIVGRGHKITHMHAFILSLTYVMGMALTYAVAGVAAGLSGELISNALQTPWVLGSFAALFVLLALSMFGFYELQLPSALQSRLTNTSNQLHGGHISGVFAMGALSAIIMSPCVAAPMAGALLYIGKTHDAVLGGTALFTLALGMGAPLLLIGSSAGALLPKAGAWMESVKRLFGAIMLALAIWIVSPVIPVTAQMLLWGSLLVLAAIYLHALDALPGNANGWRKLWKGIGVLALLLGASYLIGALSGATDILHPLGNVGRSATAAPATLRFERIKSSAELDARIAAADQPIMLDFYADWCVSCKEMERLTFSDATIQARLKNTILLQADVTANNGEDKALLQRFQLFGPPAILFFDNRGKELSDLRVTGYQDPAQFGESLQHVGL